MAYLIPTVFSVFFALCILSNEGVYGSENVQKNCNTVCPLIYRPLCGTDGKTYSNQCFMDSKINCDGLVINKAYDGECMLEKEDYRPHCVPDDDALVCGCPCAIRCSDEYIPVCGTDGKTYSNGCQLATTNSCDETPVRKCYDGECKS